jgi:hypothetical protein
MPIPFGYPAVFYVLTRMDDVDKPCKRVLLEMDNPGIIYDPNLDACGYVEWDATPPAGVSSAIHNLSFLDAVETAMLFLETDYEGEWLLVGPSLAAMLRTMMQFKESRSKMRCGDYVRLGWLCTKTVYVDRRMNPSSYWYAGHKGRFVRGLAETIFVKHTH